MSYGLKLLNPSGELVISSDAKGLFCIGKAMLQGSVTQPYGNAASDYPGRTWGGSTYRIAWPGPIFVAIDLPLGKFVGVMSVTQPFAGAWDINCHCGDTPDSNFFYAQSQVDVWAFGFSSTVLENYGLAIYDTSGALAHDLSRPNLLYPRAYVLDSGMGTTIPALTRPVVIGCPTSYQIFDGQPRIHRYTESFFSGTWNRSSSTHMSANLVCKQFYTYYATESRSLGDDGTSNSSAFIIEGSTLP